MSERKNAIQDGGTEEAGSSDKPDDKQPPAEIGGRDGPEPTRYGDWEKNGIISDF